MSVIGGPRGGSPVPLPRTKIFYIPCFLCKICPPPRRLYPSLSLFETEHAPSSHVLTTCLVWRLFCVCVQTVPLCAWCNGCFVFVYRRSACVRRQWVRLWWRIVYQWPAEVWWIPWLPGLIRWVRMPHTRYKYYVTKVLARCYATKIVMLQMPPDYCKASVLFQVYHTPCNEPATTTTALIPKSNINTM